MSDTPNTNDDAGRDARHKARMVRKKEVVDSKIAAAQNERGVIVITTGNGKGKSSSGFGMVVRAMGHGMRTGVVQFIKGAFPSGEEMFLRRFPEECEFHVMGEGYTWETQDRARDVAKAEAAWEVARRMLRDPSFDLILFDELNIALKLHYLDLDTVIADLRARPPKQHVVITGRGAPSALIEAADTVTDMTPVKHAFEQGIKAQPGVEM
ncbi:cob(I)yrinic acid a,c-diamide adenosyltransferase [Cupriavidus metallidurans]|jgi:cob(I)alamin adenosyltransferase|uniref:Corrinoid adenosyltransferase n=1 Tax=Cupriavidus metallidurans (strain ATCC 43123 / DSM 2839 / NBRC 102507 / CH34) TaxID=266264 RepID=Q1LJL7_CUPMC|nr:cob(I)yrinic acid a,c-diamide adenosyltransferase [Cupriavidus metallidurans]ABF09659.1 cob(I)alamin adenolsyltransferase/cobinamide ATP-dependent adenolsyltransferase [Cupriavidus metallidurans CH34]AVA36822.1 cob(I)yrinic acid a,c-diamide adenosyltransferase [Cupriavidus metallidurans]QGS29500.1 cob(I)yrinic acid a,c-diamide adenosyltransferase [Cupriavidus metallidurans]UBM10342.1 cob(I)yrinic acid a,c-diamide adenosyltransferase [Cupriavidus metallidurans]